MSEGSGFAQAAVDALIAPLEASLDQVPSDGPDLEAEQRKSIFEKIRFSWRPEDQLILDRIKIAVDEEFTRNFGSAIRIVEKFYAQIRMPKMHMIGGEWMPQLDAHGRQIWDVDENGHFKEDWSQLTGQDLEEAFMNLERVRLNVGPRISELLSQAIYAKHCAGDIHDDVYTKVVDGTINDRTARANRDSRMDKYHAFFRYSIWLTSKEFYDEVGRFVDYLTKIRSWKSFERER